MNRCTKLKQQLEWLLLRDIMRRQRLALAVRNVMVPSHVTSEQINVSYSFDVVSFFTTLESSHSSEDRSEDEPVEIWYISTKAVNCYVNIFTLPVFKTIRTS